MAQVSVTINGRQYRMACDDGQENQLIRLAGDLDRSIANVRTNFGEIGDMRLTVMAALLLAEELADLRSRLNRAEAEIADLRQARDSAAARASEERTILTTAIHEAAHRIEQAAGLLGHCGEEENTAIG